MGNKDSKQKVQKGLWKEEILTLRQIFILFDAALNQ